jgi:glycosyltransferase involved in cell wall biosynthesis
VRLVFVTQTVDPESPVLGATVAKIRALAARVDEVVVLADSAVPGALPGNCRVHLFRGATKAGRGARFELALARDLARSPRPSALLAHMCPIYAVLGAPLARPRGTRVLLWFTHWRQSRTLELAERASNAVLTVERSTFPLPSAKVIAIGHGIDVARFPCVERAAGSQLRLLALGRMSPAKGLDNIVRAMALVPSARLQVRGPSLTDEERAHRSALAALVAALGLEDRVEIGGAVAPDDVPVLLGGADALVNNMRAGATDKVVFEAAATCLPVLASNPSFAGFLPDELRFEREEPESLANRIGWLAGADRGAIGRELRARVEREHSVDGWAERVVAAASHEA